MAQIKEVSPEDILPPEVDFRKEIDKDHIESIARTVEAGGRELKDPIEVRPKDGKYQILTGEGYSRYQAILLIRPKITKVPIKIFDLDDRGAIIHGLVREGTTLKHKPEEMGDWVRYILDHYGVSISWIQNTTGIPDRTLRSWREKSGNVAEGVNIVPEVELERLREQESEAEKKQKQSIFEDIVKENKEKVLEFAQGEGLKPIAAANKLVRIGLDAIALKDFEQVLEPNRKRIEKFMNERKTNLVTALGRLIDVGLCEEGF